MPTQYSQPIGPSQPIGRTTQGQPVFPEGLSKAGEGYKPPNWYPAGGGSAIPSSSVTPASSSAKVEQPKIEKPVVVTQTPTPLTPQQSYQQSALAKEQAVYAQAGLVPPTMAQKREFYGETTNLTADQRAYYGKVMSGEITLKEAKVTKTEKDVSLNPILNLVSPAKQGILPVTKVQGGYEVQTKYGGKSYAEPKQSLTEKVFSAISGVSRNIIYGPEKLQPRLTELGEKLPPKAQERLKSLSFMGPGFILGNVINVPSKNLVQPKITFVAQKEVSKSGEETLKVITGTRFSPKDVGVSVSKEKILPLGKEGTSFSIGAGISKTKVGNKETLTRFLTGGKSQELGKAKIVTKNINKVDKSFVTSVSKQIDRQSFLGKGLAKELQKVSNGKIVETTPDLIRSNVLGVFKENPDGSFNFIGSSSPLMRVYKSGKVTFTAKDLNIQGKIIQVIDEKGFTKVIPVKSLSPELKQSLANQLSAVIKKAKVESPKITTPKTIISPLYNVPSYLGGGTSLNPEAESKQTGFSLITGMSVKEQPQVIARSPVSLVITTEKPKVREKQEQQSFISFAIPQVTTLVTKQGESQKETQKVIDILGSASSQISRQQQVTRQVQRVTPRETPSRPTRPITPFLPRPTLKKGSTPTNKQILGEMFEVYGKRFGKDIKLFETESEIKARQKLKGFLGTTLGRSGFIEKGGKRINVNLGLGFRPSKREVGRVVQEAKFSLGSSGEKQEIQLFKSIKRKSKKRKKKFNLWD